MRAGCICSDNGAKAFRDVRTMTMGMVDCTVQRVNYTGILGHEICRGPMAQRERQVILWAVRKVYGIQPLGMRAMMGLRLDKLFGSWLRDCSPDNTPGETGLDRFILVTKPVDFIGRRTAAREGERGAKRKRCAFTMDALDADVVGHDPIWWEGKVQGFCTSGGYSQHAGQSIAPGFVPPDRAQEGLEVGIEITGQMRPARPITTPLFDADGARMRG